VGRGDSLAVAWENELVVVDLREGEVVVHEEPDGGSKKAEKSPIRSFNWFISSVGAGSSQVPAFGRDFSHADIAWAH
jgi:hypothetical protein